MSIKQSPLKLTRRPDQAEDEVIAEKLLQPSFLSAAVIDAYKNNVQRDGINFPLAASGGL